MTATPLAAGARLDDGRTITVALYAQVHGDELARRDDRTQPVIRLIRKEPEHDAPF